MLLRGDIGRVWLHLDLKAHTPARARALCRRLDADASSFLQGYSVVTDVPMMLHSHQLPWKPRLAQVAAWEVAHVPTKRPHFAQARCRAQLQRFGAASLCQATAAMLSRVRRGRIHLRSHPGNQDQPIAAQAAHNTRTALTQYLIAYNPATPAVPVTRQVVSQCNDTCRLESFVSPRGALHAARLLCGSQRQSFDAHFCPHP